jgi:hypothetical protein
MWHRSADHDRGRGGTRHRRNRHNQRQHGARRRHSGGGPGVGCARMPIGTCLYLHAVAMVTM